MAAGHRVLQIWNAMLSVVRMKFAFEMIAFRTIITWTLWLLLLLLLLVALRNWLVIYSLSSSSLNELCLCNSKSRRTKEKDRLDHESNKSTGRWGGVGLSFGRETSSNKHEKDVITFDEIYEYSCRAFAFSRTYPLRCYAYLWRLHNHGWQT